MIPFLMLDIQVIDDPAAATVALWPMRSRLVSELAAPASAATLATRVGLARREGNFDLHALEAHGLLRLSQTRKWCRLAQRLLVTTHLPPAAARIAWSSCHTLNRGNPSPRSNHEREERSQRSPVGSGRIRSPRHAGGSLAGHRHRAGYFVLVRAG